ELEHDSSAVAQLRGFWHDRIPVAAYARQYPLHVVAEVHAFSRGQNLIGAVHPAAGYIAAPQASAATGRSARSRGGKSTARSAARRVARHISYTGAARS